MTAVLIYETTLNFGLTCTRNALMTIRAKASFCAAAEKESSIWLFIRFLTSRLDCNDSMQTRKTEQPTDWRIQSLRIYLSAKCLHGFIPSDNHPNAGAVHKMYIRKIQYQFGNRSFFNFILDLLSPKFAFKLVDLSIQVNSQ